MSLQDEINFGINEFGRNIEESGDQVFGEARPPVPTWLRQDLEALEGQQLIVGTAESFDELILPSEANRGVVRDVGMPNVVPDAIAFYLPFHYYPERWGIYYSESGLRELAEGIKGRPLAAGDQGILDLTLKLLFDHERFHFMAEIAATRAEVILVSPVYDVYFANGSNAEHEEAMANAQALRGLGASSPAATRERIAHWMLNQGPGYRDFETVLAPADWNWARGLITASMIEFFSGSLHPFRLPTASAFLLPTMGKFKVPQYIVRDGATKVFDVVKKFPKEHGIQVHTHSNDHPPPHFHIHDTSGQLLSRYTWPGLTAMEGDEELPRRYEKNLRVYLRKHGAGIKDRLEKTLNVTLPDLEC